jgi:hypothetical protein
MAKSQFYVSVTMLQGRKIKVLWLGFYYSVTYLYDTRICILFLHWDFNQLVNQFTTTQTIMCDLA